MLMCLPITRNIMVAPVATPSDIENSNISKLIPTIFRGTNWVPSSSPAAIARIIPSFGNCLFCCFCVVFTIVMPMRSRASPISAVSKRIMGSLKYRIPHDDDNNMDVPTKSGVDLAMPSLVILFRAKMLPVAQISPELNPYRFAS